MNAQSIELQIAALNQLKQELENLVKEIDLRSQSYYEHVKALENLDVEVARTYEQQYWSRDYQLFESLKSNIHLYDTAYIDRCISSAYNALSNFKS